MPTISFHPLATRELNDAANYYELESSGLGLRFVAAVEAAVWNVAEFPDSGASLKADVRRVLVRGFPYGARTTQMTRLDS